MKNSKPTLILGIGLILQAVARGIGHYVDIPSALQYAMMLSAVALMMWGIIKIARSPKMKNSRLRRWKLRLISKKQTYRSIQKG